MRLHIDKARDNNKPQALRVLEKLYCGCHTDKARDNNKPEALHVLEK